MTMSKNKQSQQSEQSLQPAIIRGRFQQLTIYEISDTELEILERGSPVSIYLNFAISLLSVAISLTASLLTSINTPTTVFIIFVLCIIVGSVLGLFFLILWFKKRKSVSDCIEKIRKRLPPEGDSEPLIEITNITEEKTEVIEIESKND